MSTRIYLSNEVEGLPAYAADLSAGRRTKQEWLRCCGTRFVPFGESAWYVEHNSEAPLTFPEELSPHITHVTRRTAVHFGPELVCGKYEHGSAEMTVTRDLHSSGKFFYWLDGTANTLHELNKLEDTIRSIKSFQPVCNFDNPEGPTYAELKQQLEAKTSECKATVITRLIMATLLGTVSIALIVSRAHGC